MTRGRFGKRRPRGPVILLAVFCGLLAATAYGAGLLRFAAATPMAVADPDTPTDAIVVLTGGAERLSTGLRLLADQKARMVLVSGVYEHTDIRQLLHVPPTVREMLDCCVEAGRDARNTAGNAEETAAWMRRHDFHSLRLVTASYHMPRSMMEFRHALPAATLIPHPVFPDHVKHEDWWKWPGTTALIVGEFNKFLLAWTRLAVDRTLSGLLGADGEHGG